MITKEQLGELSSKEKDALILEQARRIELHEARISELEALLKGLQKTSKNSSKPPSQDRKANLRARLNPRGQKKKGRKGVARELHPSPDEILESKLKNCQSCDHPFEEGDHQLQNEYDKIEIPLIKAKVTRVRLYRGCCQSCGASAVAPAPQGFESGSPFGRSIEALIVYLRYGHHIGYKRLCELMYHVMGLKISQGALANMFRRLHPGFDRATQQILERIRSSKLVCSDETGARVKGKNAWEWVFQNDQVALHVIRPSRGAAVVTEVLGNYRPEYWISDLYSAQKGHAEKWQVCLAHQLRDCEYGIENGDKSFSWRMKKLFLRAIALSKRRDRLRAITLKAYRYRLEQDLDQILALTPMAEAGEKLKRRYLKNRDHLFTFLDDPSLEPTNNSSERALRPSVIFRKVTNGFRSDWGADFFADVRSIIGTGQRQGLNPYQAIQNILTPCPIL